MYFCLYITLHKDSCDVPVLLPPLPTSLLLEFPLLIVLVGATSFMLNL